MFHFGRAELLATTVAALVILTRIGLTIPLHPASVLRVGGTIPVASGGRVLTLCRPLRKQGQHKEVPSADRPPRLGSAHRKRSLALSLTCTRRTSEGAAAGPGGNRAASISFMDKQSRRSPALGAFRGKVARNDRCRVWQAGGAYAAARQRGPHRARARSR